MSQSAEPTCACAHADARPRWKPSARKPSALLRGFAYLASHWRGELALLPSFIVNGLAVGAVALASASALGWSLDSPIEPGAAAVGLTAVWTGIALITLWQVVGVLRAADRHARAGRGRFAFGGALIAALLGVLISTGVFVRAGLPHIVEASQFALGKDPIGDVALRVSPDGSALELEGPIVYGVASRVRDALQANPDITVVRFISPGGRVVEARELRDLLRKRGVTTIAAGNCASACVVAFMAGRDRLLGTRGTLGFHRYRSPGLDDTEAEASMAIDRREFVAHGVPAWFMDRAYTTPNSEMWRPTVTELAVANVVTGELAADGSRLPWLNARSLLDQQLAQQPLYATLQTVEPVVYDELLDTVEATVRAGGSVQEAALSTRPLMRQLAERYLPGASDDAIVQATRVAAETMRELGARSAQSCLGYLQPANGDVSFTALPADLRQRDSEALAEVIESGATALPRARGRHALADLKKVHRSLAAEFGDDVHVLERLQNPEVEPAVACAVVTALYERALALPAPRNAQLLRYLLAGV